VTSDLPVVHLTALFYIKIEIFTFKNRKMVPSGLLGAYFIIKKQKNKQWSNL
jgi:hypothetical protein